MRAPLYGTVFCLLLSSAFAEESLTLKMVDYKQKGSADLAEPTPAISPEQMETIKNTLTKAKLYQEEQARAFEELDREE